MDLKKIALGTLAYTAVTFPLAAVWHVVLFKTKYDAFGYFQGEPNFLLGLLTILIQGAVLSWLFPRIRFSSSGPGRGLRFALAIGVFFWTSHVLAFVAKQAAQSAWQFVAMETVYLALQFGIFGVLISLIYRRDTAS